MGLFGYNEKDYAKHRKGNAVCCKENNGDK